MKLDVNEREKKINRFSSWRFNSIQVNMGGYMARTYEKRFFFPDHRNNGRFVILHNSENSTLLKIVAKWEQYFIISVIKEHYENDLWK